LSLDNIRNAILTEAQAEANRILTAAKRSAQKRLSDARERLEEEYDARLKAQLQTINDDAARAILELKSKLALELLQEKNRVIDEVFRIALERLRGMPGDEYLSLLVSWLGGIEEDVTGEVALNAEDSGRVGAKLVEALNAKRGKDAFRLASQPADISGGCVFRCDAFELDRSFDTLLANARETLLPEIARQAFPDDADGQT